MDGDMLGLYKEAGWGWALWNFAGSFGVCDSGRADVKYETWHGRKLDRAMYEVCRRSESQDCGCLLVLDVNPGVDH